MHIYRNFNIEYAIAIQIYCKYQKQFDYSIHFLFQKINIVLKIHISGN